MKNLFEHYDQQSKSLKIICDNYLKKFESNGLTYSECSEFLNEVENIGYTFDYGLDAEPFNLRKAEFYFQYIVPDHEEHSYNSYEKAQKKAKKINQKVYLCIYSKQNRYNEVYDEEVVSSSKEIPKIKYSLIRVFKKLTKENL